MSVNKKIYYSIDDVYPPYRVDVAELFGTELPKLGFDVEWYMRASSQGISCTSFKGQRVRLPTFANGRAKWYRLFNRLAFLFGDIAGMIRALYTPFDAIQVRDKYFAALLGLLCARIKGIPFFYWCSYPFPEHYLELAQQSKGIKNIYQKIHGLIGVSLLYRFVMRHSDHNFVQSEKMKTDLMVFGIPEDKMTPIPMGIPTSMLKWLKDSSHKVKSKQIVYLGSLAEIRHIEVVIESFAIVLRQDPNARLILVGDGDVPTDVVRLKTLVQKHQMNDVVTFTGFLPIEVAWGYAAESAICLSPIYPTQALLPASPTKLVEYMALGRPIVCNAHPEQSAIIADSAAGLCVPWGVNEFANAILYLLSHPNEAQIMADKGPPWVAEHRTYPMIAQKVAHIYSQVFGMSK